MYLLYVDHSGEISNTAEKYFVMAGAAIFERQIWFLEQSLNSLQKEHLPDVNTRVEFHASPIRNHNKPPWDTMPKEKRDILMSAVYGAIANANQKGLCLFGQALEKSQVVPNFANLMKAVLEKRAEAQNKLSKAQGEERTQAKQELGEVQKQYSNLVFPILTSGCEGLCYQFEFFLKRFHTDNPDEEQRGMFIFDHGSYENEVGLLMDNFRTIGTKYTPLYNLVEAPFWADSQATRMLQIADFVSYAVYRRYEIGDANYFDIIGKRFDEQLGVMHGLRHFTSNSECLCAPCITKRLARKNAP